jgi:hypothetical protein
MREVALQKIPMEEEELAESYAEAKKEAVAMFSKKAVGSAA